MAKRHLFATPEPKAAEPSNTLPVGHVWIDLIDDHGAVAERISVGESNYGYRVRHEGAFWEHVSDHADGTWQFARK